jgi:hypothetical protein
MRPVYSALLSLEIEKGLIVNIVSLSLINNKVNEQKECLNGCALHFDGANLRITRGKFAKKGSLIIEFNRNYDKVLSISPQKCPKFIYSLVFPGILHKKTTF